MKNYVQTGNTIALTAPYAVASGDGLRVGYSFGIATGAGHRLPREDGAGASTNPPKVPDAKSDPAPDWWTPMIGFRAGRVAKLVEI